MPILNNSEFLEETARRIKQIQDSSDYKNQIEDLANFIQYNTTEQQKELLSQLALGYGGNDYIGSTKLGSGTGIVLHGALGQGTEGGSIDGNRINKENALAEQFSDNINELEGLANSMEKISMDREKFEMLNDMLQEQMEANYTPPSPFDISGGPKPY